MIIRQYKLQTKGSQTLGISVHNVTLAQHNAQYFKYSISTAPKTYYYGPLLLIRISDEKRAADEVRRYRVPDGVTQISRYSDQPSLIVAETYLTFRRTSHQSEAPNYGRYFSEEERPLRNHIQNQICRVIIPSIYISLVIVRESSHIIHVY